MRPPNANGRTPCSTSSPSPSPLVAVFLAGRPFAALLNPGLTFLFIVSGVILSVMTVNEHKADNRACRIVKSNRLV